MTVEVRQVDEIVAIDDPVLRNLQITVAYGRMAVDFGARVDRRNLSWAGFGTWASEGVGGAIRHHQTDKSWVLRAFRWSMPRHYHVVAGIAADAFARGNRAVFDHIGRGFAEFHAAIDDPDPGAVDRFLGRHRAPEQPADGVGIDVGFEPPVGLADGFAHYRAAIDEPDDRRRAQLVAAANLCLAFVEQIRLQEPIETAFSSLLTGRWRRPFSRAIVARLFTETTLKLRLGDDEVRPGRPLPDLGGKRWPEDLVRLDDDLFERFAAVVVGPDARRAPDADDWTSLRDRLRYIGALMRSRQQVAGLIGRLPFGDELVEEIEAGRIPAPLAPTVKPA